MKIIDILLENQAPSNKILTSILTNSNLMNSQNKDALVAEITTLFQRFKQLQNSLNPDSSQVITFLNHFDGIHAHPKFNSDVKDITKYTLDQLRFLVDEFAPVGGNGITNDETGVLLKKSYYDDETAEISKKLWYDEGSAIINEEGFRVYQPKNQADSIKFGWYEEKLQKEVRPGHYAWCITWRPGEGRTNRWGSYRSEGGTFYFIIDESKYNSTDIGIKKYYLCALQVISKREQPNHPTGYELTDITNPGEINKTWDEIVGIYPQLAEYKDMLVEVPYSREELEVKSIVGEMSEREGSPYNFARMARKYKKQYIDELQKITRPESWFSMDKELRKSYIVLTPKGDFRYRFPNFELVRAIKKTGEGKLLNDEMIRKDGNEGLKSLSEYLMSDLRVQEERVGIVNPNIVLYKTQNKKYGLWDTTTLDWVTINDTTYEPSFILFDEQIVENPQTKEKFYVDMFGDMVGTNSEYFVAVTPFEDIDSYFITKRTWDTIKDKFNQEGTEMMVDKLQDINEKEKGL
jgi:hypothetical protein